MTLCAIEPDLFDRVKGLFDLVVFNVPSTIAVTSRGMLLKYLGARLLPKRLLDAAAHVVAWCFTRRAPERHALLDAIAAGARHHLGADGRLVLLVQSTDLPRLLGEATLVRSDVIHLRQAPHVRLVVLAYHGADAAGLDATGATVSPGNSARL